MNWPNPSTSGKHCWRALLKVSLKDLSNVSDNGAFLSTSFLKWPDMPNGNTTEIHVIYNVLYMLWYIIIMFLHVMIYHHHHQPQQYIIIIIALPINICIYVYTHWCHGQYPCKQISDVISDVTYAYAYVSV